MAYCTTDDLLIGDITVTPIQLQDYVDRAADQMDSELGLTYELPLAPFPFTPHVELLLKRVNLLLASGQFIMDRSLVGEQYQLQAYGRSLYDEGKSLLTAIVNGGIQLAEVVKLASGSAEGNAPTIINRDDSFVDWYQDQYLTPSYPRSLYWPWP